MQGGPGRWVGEIVLKRDRARRRRRRGINRGTRLSLPSWKQAAPVTKSGRRGRLARSGGSGVLTRGDRPTGPCAGVDRGGVVRGGRAGKGGARRLRRPRAAAPPGRRPSSGPPASPIDEHRGQPVRRDQGHRVRDGFRLRTPLITARTLPLPPRSLAHRPPVVVPEPSRVVSAALAGYAGWRKPRVVNMV